MISQGLGSITSACAFIPAWRLVIASDANPCSRGYAIEMIDQVYDRNGSDVPLEVAMINALGYVNG